MSGDLYNEELVGRAVGELKAMRQTDIKREWINKQHPCCTGVR